MTTRTSPAPKDIVERAREIAPLIAAQSDSAQTLRDIPPASAAAMREAGLFRLYQPVEWGGYECEPDTFMDVQDVFAEVCLSHAWVQGVLAVQPLVIALFEHAAQADVWGRDSSAVVASAFQPTGKAVPEKGGYRLSGRWLFSSGSSVADWVAVGAIVPSKDGKPEMRLFLVPKRDYRIDDVWHSFGLRGTGSNDILIDNAFVPIHRSYVGTMGITNFLQAERPRSLLYRLPWLPFYSLATGNLAIGAGRAALRIFYDMARTRIGGFSGLPLRDDPGVAEIGPLLEGEIRQIDMTTRAGVRRFIDYAQSDTIIPMEEALAFRAHTSSTLRRITDIVEKMTLLTGAKGTTASYPLTRLWLDLCAARMHPGNNPSGSVQMLGKMRLAPQA